MDIRRKEKVFFQIVQLSPELLEIEPMPSYRSSSSHDLSVELSCLKEQLLECHLKEKEDYQTERDDFKSSRQVDRIYFKGKSGVVRALYALPVEWIQFSAVGYGFKTPTDKNELEKTRCEFALGLNSKTCFYNEIQYVMNAQQFIFNELKNKILDIHKNFYNKKSAVIEKLNKDMELISAGKDNLFEYTHFQLLCSALHAASDSEKSSPTIKSHGMKLYKHSKLSPEYDTLISKYAPLVPFLFHPTNVSNVFEPILENINTCYGLINFESKKVLEGTR